MFLTQLRQTSKPPGSENGVNEPEKQKQRNNETDLNDGYAPEQRLRMPERSADNEPDHHDAQ